MDVATITSLITTVGFPIAVCVALFWFIYKVYQKSIDRENELREEIKENQKINGKFAEIINRYSLEIGEIKTDVKEIKQDIIIITEKMS